MEMFTKIAQAFEHGGIWMWPIALFQVISVAIIIERFVALYKNRKMEELQFVDSFEDGIRRGEIESVINKAQTASTEHAVAKAVVAGAKAAANFGGKDEIQGKMDEVLLFENSLLDTRIGFLAMLGNVAT